MGLAGDKVQRDEKGIYIFLSLESGFIVYIWHLCTLF